MTPSQELMRLWLLVEVSVCIYALMPALVVYLIRRRKAPQTRAEPRGAVEPRPGPEKPAKPLHLTPERGPDATAPVAEPSAPREISGICPTLPDVTAEFQIQHYEYRDPVHPVYFAHRLTPYCQRGGDVHITLFGREVPHGMVNGPFARMDIHGDNDSVVSFEGGTITEIRIVEGCGTNEVTIHAIARGGHTLMMVAPKAPPGTVRIFGGQTRNPLTISINVANNALADSAAAFQKGLKRHLDLIGVPLEHAHRKNVRQVGNVVFWDEEKQ